MLYIHVLYEQTSLYNIHEKIKFFLNIDYIFYAII